VYVFTIRTDFYVLKWILIYSMLIRARLDKWLGCSAVAF
jgi:hypothetical protein